MRAMPEITELIPQRAPMLMVDRVLDLGHERALTETTFESESAFYQGFYPGNPVTPGVFLCEAVHQTAAALIAYRGASFEGTPVLTRVYGSKFRDVVPPGSRVETEVVLTGRVAGVYYCTGKVRLDGVLVLEHRCALGMRQGGALRTHPAEPERAGGRR